MEGLKFFTRTNDRGLWNVASFHSPHSLTWSWILSLRFPKKDQGRWFFFHSHRGNQGLGWHLCVAKCSMQWQTQRPMYYRDMWRRADERKRREEYEAWQMRAASRDPAASEGHRTLQ